MVSFLMMLIVLGVIVLVTGFVYQKFKGKSDKANVIVRLNWYKYIGNNKVYVGNRFAEEWNDRKLGVCLRIKGMKKGLSGIDPSDYFGDFKYSKNLNVCEYSPDDIRVMSRVSDGVFKMRSKPKVIEIPNPSFDKDDPKSTRYIEDFAKDKDGNVIYDSYAEPLEEVISVDQDSRTAMRFDRTFSDRMDELLKEEKGKWEKVLPVLGIVFVGLILIIGFVVMNKYNSETQIQISQDFKNGVLENYNSDNLVDKVADLVQNRGGVVDDPNK